MVSWLLDERVNLIQVGHPSYQGFYSSCFLNYLLKANNNLALHLYLIQNDNNLVRKEMIASARVTI